MAWPDSGTNEVTKTVGATGRNHSTIAAWEADTDDDCTAGWGAGDYASPCSPVGECYDDGDLTNAYIYGATTDSTHYRRLTVAVGQRHDGTYGGGGVEVAVTSNLGLLLRDQFGVIEWLLVSGAYNSSPCSYYGPADSQHMFRNIVSVLSNGNQFLETNMGAGGESWAQNCISHGSSSGQAFRDITYVQNCTAYKTTAYGIQGCECTNVICIGSSTACFFSCTGDYNIGSDTSAPGANSIDNETSAIFANVTGGSEDLHLASGTTAADGAGLAVSGLAYDIDGDAYTDPPDIGADQWVGGAPPTSRFNVAPMAMYYRRKRAS